MYLFIYSRNIQEYLLHSCAILGTWDTLINKEKNPYRIKFTLLWGESD